MPADKNTNPIRCASLASPSPGSAFLSVTDQTGTTHRFDLTISQLRLFHSQAAEMVEKWPIEGQTPGQKRPSHALNENRPGTGRVGGD